MDLGYIDFNRLYRLSQSLAFFVTRAKSNMAYHRVYSNPVDKSSGLRSDQIILLDGYYASKACPEKLRRTRYFDHESGRTITFLSNNFSLPGATIAQLYKCRWQIELFFRWIKQHLRIKGFYGTSSNAVKMQILIAISVYVLVAIMKKRLHLRESFYTVLQVLSVTAFEQVDILEVLSNFSHNFMDNDQNKKLHNIDLYPGTSDLP